MREPLRVLMVEDSEDDALLIARELSRAGYEIDFARVDTLEAMNTALVTGEWDLITSDSSMPEFSGVAALTVLKRSQRDVPFIVVSGTIGEEAAVSLMRAGAHDYVLKGNLTRLAAAVERELREAETRRQRRIAEVELAHQRERLYHSQKLAAMGELLAGVAHELNNPLAVVVGQANMLRRTAEGPLAARAEKIENAAQRCARIVGNFVALARKQPASRAQVAINQVVREALELLAYPLRVDGIGVELCLAEDLPPLWADGHQLHQVVINLATNASHALSSVSGPRRLSIATRQDKGRQHVLIEVGDNGAGVPDDLRSRIFEPFFTTKPTGAGTGLGLSLCQGIVESHGGSIEVQGGPGGGALFRVILPVQTPPAALEAAAVSLPVSRPRASAVILLVDDEPDVREVLADLLVSEGHQVDTAEDGFAALERLEGRAYDLIVTDLRMPGLDGTGLYREVARRHPELSRRFVFTTGDVLSPGVRDFLEEVALPQLSKPFDAADVSAVLRRALKLPEQERG
jgi:two-component system NtrC family sensor kinase